MKTKLLTIALSVIFAIYLSIPTEVSARNHNTPSWANAHKYKVETRQIYFPEYNMYYDRQQGSYIYIDNGRWNVSFEIPTVFRSRNIGNARYVEMNIKSNAPQCYNKKHLKTYRHDVRYNNDRRYAYNRYDNKYESPKNDKHSYSKYDKDDHGKHDKHEKRK